MKDLVDVTTSFPAQRSVENGDAGNGANFEECFQSSADRTGYLEALLSAGVTTIRNVSNLSALKALLTGASLEVGIVRNDDDFGLWIWLAGSATTAVTGYVEESTNGSSSAGRWWNSAAFLLGLGGVSGTSPRLSNDRLPPVNRIVSITDKYETADNTTAMTGTSNWLDAGLTSNAISVKNGDKVKIEVAMAAGSDDAAGAEFRLAAHDGASATAIAGSKVTALVIAAGSCPPTALLGFHAPGADGTFTYRVQAAGPNATQAFLSGERRMIVTVIRP